MITKYIEGNTRIKKPTKVILKYENFQIYYSLCKKPMSTNSRGQVFDL